MTSENTVNCHICNKKVEIVSTARISNDEIQDNLVVNITEEDLTGL